MEQHFMEIFRRAFQIMDRALDIVERPNPMSQPSIRRADTFVASLKNETWDVDRLTLIKHWRGALFLLELADILSCFDWDANRLKAVELLAPKLAYRGDEGLAELREVFDFPSSFNTACKTILQRGI